MFKRSASPRSRLRNGFRCLQAPIISIVIGIAVLYLGEWSIASGFQSGAQSTSGFATFEARAADTVRSLWNAGAAAVGYNPPAHQDFATARPAKVQAETVPSFSNTSNLANQSRANDSLTTKTLVTSPESRSQSTTYNFSIQPTRISLISASLHGIPITNASAGDFRSVATGNYRSAATSARIDGVNRVAAGTLFATTDDRVDLRRGSPVLLGLVENRNSVITPNSGAADQYWNTNGVSAVWTASNWGTSGAGPFTTAWTSGNDAFFTATSLITGATTTVADITASANVTVGAGVP